MVDEPGAEPSRHAAASTRGRIAVIYAGYAVAVLFTQLVLFVVLDEDRALPLMAPVCLVVLPAIAWAAGWWTVGVAFRGPRGPAQVDRGPRLGALICLAPNLLLCAGLAALLLASRSP